MWTPLHRLVIAAIKKSDRVVSAFAEFQANDSGSDPDNKDADGRLPYGVMAGDAGYDSAISLSELLDSYNNGNEGVSHCDDGDSGSDDDDSDSEESEGQVMKGPMNG